jgi:hypothetical protein
MRQGIEERARRGIVRLTALTEQSRSGGEQNEKVERLTRKQAMQQPTSCDLGPEDTAERRSFHLQKRSVF